MQTLTVVRPASVYTQSLLALEVWTTDTLTFSFPTLAQYGSYTPEEDLLQGFATFTEAQMTATRAILAQIESFTNLDFVEITGVNAGSAVLRFANTSFTDSALAFLPSADEIGGDSWYANQANVTDPDPGDYGYLTILHEIGHALGLSHPHEPDVGDPMPADRDWMAFSVMSYRSYQGGPFEYSNSPGNFAQSYMMEDIAALQYVYGANFSKNAGNTVYTWDTLTGQMFINGVAQAMPETHVIFTTVWDGGGIDTYDFTGTDINYIDLRPGGWTGRAYGIRAPDLGTDKRAPGNIANAYLFEGDPRSLIENAIGGNSGSTIHGNQISNRLEASVWGSSLFGHEGNDTLIGNAGFDELDGGSGDDIIRGGDGGDRIFGFEGNDQIWAGADLDIVQAGDGDDLVFGEDSNDELFGGNGNDRLVGGAFADELTGGDGDDILEGGDHRDILRGGNGQDRLIGGTDYDVFDGGAGIDTTVVAGLRSAYTITATGRYAQFNLTGPDGPDKIDAVEYIQFDDALLRLLPGTSTAVNFNTSDPAVYRSAMAAIRDFDGNNLGGGDGWLRIGAADINGDGDTDQILVNRQIGRFATVGTPEPGLVYFSDYGWAGETRVVGTYIDPLVASGAVAAGSDNDSQRRFQNDLLIENINQVLGADDYDGDGLQEVYLALTDGSAFLHAYMHADGNIRYANYQSQAQVIDYLTSHGFGSDTYADWLV